MSRIGQTANGKSQPIKIVFKNKEEKKKLLRRLYILKDMEKYERISVTEDLTPKERRKV